MKYYLTSVIMLCFVFTALAQTQVKPVLTSNDVDRFIKTYKPMTADFEAIGDDIEVEDEMDEDNPTYASILNSFQVVLQSQKAIDILEKYGWDKNTYAQKILAISMGMSYLIMMQHINEMSEEDGKALAITFAEQAKQYVHEDDLALLKPRILELEQFMDEE